MTSTIRIPKIKTEYVNHITEEEMYFKFNNINSWLSDSLGIIEVYIEVN